MPAPAAQTSGDSVIGMVVYAATGRPVGSALVTAGAAAGTRPPAYPSGRAGTDRAREGAVAITDSAGRFVLRGLRPGSWVVAVETRPYLAARRTVLVPRTERRGAAESGGDRPPVLRIALRRAPAPRVALGGRWILEVTRDPPLPGVTPAVAPTRGTLTLRDTIDARGGAVADPTAFRLAIGAFVRDAAPRPGRDAAGTAAAPGRSEEAVGVVFFGDSVLVRIGPRAVTHVDLMLRGRLDGDVARGVLEAQGGRSGGAEVGRFVMRRVR